MGCGDLRVNQAAWSDSADVACIERLKVML